MVQRGAANSPQEWCEKAVQFGQRWNFHHAMEDLDGKHVAIRCPKSSGCWYYSYKGFYSVVILAVVDADVKFLWVKVGSNGLCSETWIFNECQLNDNINDGTIRFSETVELPGDGRDTPYFIVAYDAFALRTKLMKPFSRQNLTNGEHFFTYRLSRAGFVVENAFGILANQFRCLLTRVAPNPDTEVSVLTCATFHNSIRTCYGADHHGLADNEDPNH